MIYSKYAEKYGWASPIKVSVLNKEIAMLRAENVALKRRHLEILQGMLGTVQARIAAIDAVLEPKVMVDREEDMYHE
jgi:hypothetical protein